MSGHSSFDKEIFLDHVAAGNCMFIVEAKVGQSSAIVDAAASTASDLLDADSAISVGISHTRIEKLAGNFVHNSI